jgi:transcriptional regulator with XRE-family HTH domain
MAGKRSAFSTYNTLRRDRDPAVQSVYAEFARRLQAKMQERGWNQSELARRCAQLMPKAAKGQKQNVDFGRDRISHYVRGISMPRPESLTVLAKALGCAESDLLPPMSVPSAGAEAPPFEMTSVGGDRVALRINRTVTLNTANKIIALLQKEDEA